MEITGELFVDVARFRRMVKAEFGWVQRLSALSVVTFAVAVIVAVWGTPLAWAVALLAIMVAPTVPFTPAHRLTRLYQFAGPIVWHYRIDGHGFRVTGRRTVAGSWAHYRSVVETEEFWLVRHPFRPHRVALPKAAFGEADRRAITALLHERRPATVSP